MKRDKLIQEALDELKKIHDMVLEYSDKMEQLSLPIEDAVRKPTANVDLVSI